MKLPTIFSKTLNPLLPALFLLLVTGVFDAGASNSKDDKDDFKWEEAAGEVLNLPYKQAFIDSLHKAYRVARPVKPLRVIRRVAFFKNETLVYDIGWGPFKAGYVILTAEPDPERRVIRLGGKALSNGFISAFYRMRDYVISTIDDTGLYPLFFEQHLREGKRYKSDGWILYDHDRSKLHVKERHLKTLDAEPFVNDYLSVLYVVRTMKFAPGDTFTLPLYADKKVHRLFMICKERKILQVDGDNIPCLLLEPKLVGDKGAFNKKDRLQVWLSDDEQKVPVLIKSKINIGSITAKLVRSKPGEAKPETTPDVGGAAGAAPSAGSETQTFDTAVIPTPDSGCFPKPPDSSRLPMVHDSDQTSTAPDSIMAPTP